MLEKTPGQVDFRRAAPGDAETIAAITDAAYSKYIIRIGRKPGPMTADYRQMIAEHPLWLLLVGDSIAGVLALMAEPDAMLIYSVAVRPEYQKRGLERRLLALAEEQARQAGYARIRLYTNEHMVENIALYQRLGYAETGREPMGGTALVHMAKNLGSGTIGNRP
jgi:ribosomal protein S18 acetylase RimI-like enzyme